MMMLPYTQLNAHHRSVDFTLMAIYPTDEAKHLFKQLDWHNDEEGHWQDHYLNDFRGIIKNYSRDLIRWGEIQEGESEWSTMVRAGFSFASIKDQIKIQSALFRKCVRPIHYYRFLKHVSDQREETYKWQKQLDLLEKKEVIRLLKGQER